MHGYVVLTWLKFTSIWRFIRMIALYDDIETWDNNGRYMAYVWSQTKFWRCWHRSFYKWIIRYMYVPMGGAKTKLLSMWVIFIFIGQ